jgi:transcriptional regulator with XRE-family HTH domain
MNNKIYHTCLSEALNYSDRDAFVSDLALSSIWGDWAEEIPASRIDWLRQIWTAAHRSIKDICKDAGLTQRGLAERFNIPARTIGNWATGERACPEYTRIMMQELLGLVGRDPIEYNLIYSVRGREEVVFRGSCAEASKAEDELRAVLRINDPEGVESDCYVRSDAQLQAIQRRKDLFLAIVRDDLHLPPPFVLLPRIIQAHIKMNLKGRI